MGGFGSAPQPTAVLISITLQNAEPGRHEKSLAPSSNKLDLFNDAQRAILPAGCTAEATLRDKVALDWVRVEIWLAELSVLRIADEHFSVSAIFQAATIPACYRANVFLLLKDPESLRHIGSYCAAIVVVQSICHELSSSCAAKEATACESSGLCYVLL